MKFKSVSYPLYIDDVSNYIGRLRDLFNHQLNEEAPVFKRGDKSRLVNVLGVFGELVFAHDLHARGVSYSQVNILQSSPVVGPDITIGDDIKIDVKTIGHDAPDILVNVDAHHKKTDITHYVFVQPVSPGLARYTYFKYQDVSKWPVKNVRYSNAYFKKLI